MIENLGRKVAAIAVVVAAGVAAMAVPWARGKAVIDLGLDLRGGSRLVYRFDLVEARRSGQIAPGEKPSDVLDQTIQILSERIDSLGLREIPISKQGSEGIAIELPGLDKESVDSIKGIIQSLGRLEFRIVVDPQDGIDLGAEQRKLDDWKARNPQGKIEAFGAMPNLEKLIVVDTKVTRAACEAFVELHPQITIIWGSLNK